MTNTVTKLGVIWPLTVGDYGCGLLDVNQTLNSCAQRIELRIRALSFAQDGRENLEFVLTAFRAVDGENRTNSLPSATMVVDERQKKVASKQIRGISIRQETGRGDGAGTVHFGGPFIPLHRIRGPQVFGKRKAVPTKLTGLKRTSLIMSISKVSENKVSEGTAKRQKFPPFFSYKLKLGIGSFW